MTNARERRPPPPPLPPKELSLRTRRGETTTKPVLRGNHRRESVHSPPFEFHGRFWQKRRGAQKENSVKCTHGRKEKRKILINDMNSGFHMRACAWKALARSNVSSGSQQRPGDTIRELSFVAGNEQDTHAAAVSQLQRFFFHSPLKSKQSIVRVTSS